jgi:uncharacterized membrane protein YbaN (DUF454 family)
MRERFVCVYIIMYRFCVSRLQKKNYTDVFSTKIYTPHLYTPPFNQVIPYSSKLMIPGCVIISLSPFFEMAPVKFRFPALSLDQQNSKILSI